MSRQAVTGLMAIFVVWISAGIALPMVNILKIYTPEQLLAARGLVTALLVFALLKGNILRVDVWTYAIAVIIPFASLGLFRGVREWGANPTIIVVTATPFINFAVSKAQGKPVPRVAYIGLGLLLGGVIMACPTRAFLTTGAFWAIFGTLCNGALYECFSRAKSKALQQCFWACLGIGILGLIVSLAGDWSLIIHNPLLQLNIGGLSVAARANYWLLGFAFIGGFLYWMGNIIAFEKLGEKHKDIVSVLLQGETPVVIMMAGVLLGEHLSPMQWSGVIIALCGAWYVKASLARIKT